MRKDSYKVGITVVLETGHSVFSNGIRQNGMMLAKLLKLAGHEVSILNFQKNNAMEKFPWDVNEYKTVNIFEEPDYPKNLDVLIHLQTASNESETLLWKGMNPNLKVITYQCGNNYVNDMEDILFQSREGHNILMKLDHAIDDVWYVPQQKFNNHDYYKILLRKDPRAIPFVWDPMFIDEHIKIIQADPTKNPYYNNEGPSKRISMFEPNINIVKYSMPCILATEQAYRKRPDLISFMYASNTNKLVDINLFKALMNQLDIVRDSKAQFTSRYPIVHYLESRTDIVVSHQWGNPLNYLYLDALYLGYPLVHNAELIADLGYYYEGFNMDDAANQIINAAENHDKNIREYKKDSMEKIFRYRPENKELQEEYTMLLHSLFDEDLKKSMSWELDWKTNLYNR